MLVSYARRLARHFPRVGRRGKGWRLARPQAREAGQAALPHASGCLNVCPPLSLVEAGIVGSLEKCFLWPTLALGGPGGSC